MAILNFGGVDEEVVKREEFSMDKAKVCNSMPRTST